MLQLNVEYGGIKGSAAEPNAKAGVQHQAQPASAPSNTLALPGIPYIQNTFLSQIE